MIKPIQLLTALALAVAWLAAGPSTARACACGAYITTEQAVVNGETAVIDYRDGVETIDMKMQVAGSSHDAAWIMPVPQGTEVSLGDNDRFQRLYDLTKPKEKVVYDFHPLSFLRMGSDGGAPQGIPTGGGVTVDSVSVIGPFEVSTLSATDPTALNDWLVEHGYTERPDLVPTFTTYLERGWQVLAVKLASPTGAELGGDLDALRMSFETGEVVYPILLSSHATREQDVRLYLIADGKMAVSTEASPHERLELRFAGKLAVTDIDPTLSGEDELYVTAYTTQLSPRLIEADYTFARADNDVTYQEYYERVVWVGHWAWLGIGLIALVALSLGLRAKRRR